MKQFIISCILIIAFTSATYAQQSTISQQHAENATLETFEKKYKLASAVSTADFSLLSLVDPYLSPLSYNGIGVGYQRSEQKYFDTENLNFSMRGRWNILGGIALNPTFSSAMTYVGGNYSWGAFYHYRKFKEVLFLVGSTADALVGVKTVNRNVNNPVNVDAAINLNMNAGLQYDFTLFKLPMRITYEMETPIAGYMFVPVQGASYYEMFELGNLGDALHFSSLHNKLGLKYAIGIDLKLKKSTLNLGLAQQKLLWKANSIVFEQQSFSISLGYKYDFYIFKGRNNPAPANFLNTSVF